LELIPTNSEDSFEKMKEYAAARGQEFDYLIDDTQEVGKAYDAQCTPDIFVYGPHRLLAYRGAFSGLEAAIQALLKNVYKTIHAECDGHIPGGHIPGGEGWQKGDGHLVYSYLVGRSFWREV
jgi:hypothetical protein